MEPIATVLDAWKVESLRAEWWYACRLPVNWKLAEEAFVEQYHVLQSHPQLRIPGRFPPGDPADFDPRAFVEAELRVPADDERRHGGDGARPGRPDRRGDWPRLELPADYELARSTWERHLNEAVSGAYRSTWLRHPRPQRAGGPGLNEPMGYCFPHYFVLPMYSSASSYRFRPTRARGDADGHVVADVDSRRATSPRRHPVPNRWEYDDPRWPPIPAQDFSNLPRQQRGLHARSFEYMRLSERNEGHISNYQRVIDGFLAGFPTSRLLPALRKVNVNPLEMPVLEIGF